jgi:peroxiredoxin
MMTHLKGKPAISFQLPGTSGKLFSLEAFSGQWLLLVLHRHLG